ncbi:hypothetical protein OK016_16290 [Vibrio chagasii]|nr:hypothetical protein [Vibrio chagasii]
MRPRERQSRLRKSYGTDLTLRATEGTYIKAEFAHSEGTQTESQLRLYGWWFICLVPLRPLVTHWKTARVTSVQITAVTSLYDLAPTILVQ